MPAQDVLVTGLGYVGLPLAVQAVRAGFRVTGFDTSARIVAGLNAGRSHVDDVRDEEIAAMRARGFLATTDEAGIGPQDVIVICVPTPLSVADGPDLSAARTALRSGPRPPPRAGWYGRARWYRWSPPPIRALPRRWSARCSRRRPG